MLFDVRLVGLNRKIVFKELDFCVMTNYLVCQKSLHFEVARPSKLPIFGSHHRQKSPPHVVGDFGLEKNYFVTFTKKNCLCLLLD